MIQNRLTKIDGLCLLNVLPVPVARRWQVVGVDSIYRPPPSNNNHILFITRRSKLSPGLSAHSLRHSPCKCRRPQLSAPTVSHLSLKSPAPWRRRSLWARAHQRKLFRGGGGGGDTLWRSPGQIVELSTKLHESCHNIQRRPIQYG